MNHDEIQKIASSKGLGIVHFQFNIALNTGKKFEVGYIFQNKERVLFCKRQSNSSPDAFYLCNEFRD
jgi:hypothetical protein